MIGDSHCVHNGADATITGLATYLLIWPEDGVMRKEDVRRIFDGSIFQQKADEYAEKQRMAKAGKSGRGGTIKQK